MRPPRLKIVLLPVFALGLLLPQPARADIDAVTNAFNEGVGYINGGIAFSFTTTTNLAVTSVGYLNLGASNPIVSFWSDTNFPIASYQLIPGASSGVMVYSNVALTLLSGKRYSISVQDGLLSPPTPVLLRFYTNGQFHLASQLTGYLGARITTNGTFADFNPIYFFLGPNFTFQVQTAPIQLSSLNIFASNGSSAVVSWPVLPGGFVLQHKTNLIGTNWIYTTNTVAVVNGTNQVILSPPAGNRFFRLIHP